MRTSLYDPRFEHDACGVGFVARPSGQPGHDIVPKRSRPDVYRAPFWKVSPKPTIVETPVGPRVEQAFERTRAPARSGVRARL